MAREVPMRTASWITSMLVGLVVLWGCDDGGVFPDARGLLDTGPGQEAGPTDRGMDQPSGDGPGAVDGPGDAEPPLADHGAPDATVKPDAPGGVIAVTILESNTCVISTTPASIAVKAGTEFTVNWINSAASASAVDVAKIDTYNQVPIVIGLKPGQSYHDTVRKWCGKLFTGTFSFRITGCYNPCYLPVNCGK